MEELWLSYNAIQKLDGLQPCLKLHTFYLSNNKVRDWGEIQKVSQLPDIKAVLFIGNPIYADKSKDEATVQVLKRVPTLESVDGKMVTAAQRGAAQDLE